MSLDPTEAQIAEIANRYVLEEDPLSDVCSSTGDVRDTFRSQLDEVGLTECLEECLTTIQLSFNAKYDRCNRSGDPGIQIDYPWEEIENLFTNDENQPTTLSSRIEQFCRSPFSAAASLPTNDQWHLIISMVGRKAATAYALERRTLHLTMTTMGAKPWQQRVNSLDDFAAPGARVPWLSAGESQMILQVLPEQVVRLMNDEFDIYMQGMSGIGVLGTVRDTHSCDPIIKQAWEIISSGERLPYSTIFSVARQV